MNSKEYVLILVRGDQVNGIYGSGRKNRKNPFGWRRFHRI